MTPAAAFKKPCNLVPHGRIFQLSDRHSDSPDTSENASTEEYVHVEIAAVLFALKRFMLSCSIQGRHSHKQLQSNIWTYCNISALTSEVRFGRNQFNPLTRCSDLKNHLKWFKHPLVFRVIFSYIFKGKRLEAADSSPKSEKNEARRVNDCRSTQAEICAHQATSMLFSRCEDSFQPATEEKM